MTDAKARRRVWIGLLVGVALVCVAYAIAGRSTSSGEQAKFVVLWLGILAFLWPAARRLADPLVAESERLAILVAAGLFTYLPKFLRNPRGPEFYDELAHWTQVERLHESGDLFAANPAVRVLPSYPGLHTLAEGLRAVTGLSTWQVGVVTIALLHVISAIGVFVLVRRVVASPVVAGLAGLLWCIAPGAMFFNSQFAYQSLAIVAFVWVAAALAEAQAASGCARWAWTALSSLLVVEVVVTHHLTSYALVGLLAAFAVASVALARREANGAWKPALVVLGVSVAVNAGWMWARGGRRALESIVDYLSPYPESGAEQLWKAVTGNGSRRTFFVRSGLPGWEQLAAFLAPVIVVVLGIIGLRLLARMAKRPRAGAWALAGFSALYVVSLPFVMTQSGAQGAHRSFPFSYLGICLVAGAGLALLIRRSTLSTSGAGRFGALAIVALIGIVTVGNTAANVNEFDRFPGPWEAGADSRSQTPELVAAAVWLAEYDSDDRVVADLYSGTTIGLLGTTRDACAVSAACPGDLAIWRFYDGQPIREQDLRELDRRGYRFLVVDRRMAEAVPRSGYWFNRDEEGAFERDEPLDPAALRRLEGFPWLTKVWSSSTYDLYEINVDAAGAEVLEGEPGAASVAAQERRERLRREQEVSGETEVEDQAAPATSDAATASEQAATSGGSGS